MKNNFTSQTFTLSANDQLELSDLEHKIVKSFRKERSMKAKKSTVRSILWYAASVDVKETACISKVEINMN